MLPPDVLFLNLISYLLFFIFICLISSCKIIYSHLYAIRSHGSWLVNFHNRTAQIQVRQDMIEETPHRLVVLSFLIFYKLKLSIC